MTTLDMYRKMKHLLSKKVSQGFTLVELLIVIAVMGVLATVVLVAIDPVEQLARGRDSGRKTTMSQLVTAVQSYYTSRNAKYPVADATWITTLKTTGELKSVPAAIGYSVTGAATCATNTEPATGGGWCYSTFNSDADALVFVRLESKLESSKCAVGDNPYLEWNSSRGSTCLVCGAADPTSASTCNATQ